MLPKIDSRTYVHLSQEGWQNKVEQTIGDVGEGWNYTAYYQGYGKLFITFSNISKNDRNREQSLS